MKVSREKFIETVNDVIKEGHFPHFHFCGPHENEVRSLAHSIVMQNYENRSMILEIHILDNQSESSLIQMITSFCNLQAVVENKSNKPKMVIVHQQNEILTESLVHFLEDRMTEHRVKFVYLTSSMHVVPGVLQNRMVSFTIHPESVSKLGDVDSEDKFNSILNSKEEDDIIAEKLIEWSELNHLRVPHDIYEQWYDDIMNINTSVKVRGNEY